MRPPRSGGRARPVAGAGRHRAARRADLAKRIGLRPTAAHLLSFAEHVAPHLLALSDAAWPELPTVEQVHPELNCARLTAELRTKITTGAPYTLRW